MAGKKYYKILNLTENASLKEVKKRYKQLAKKYHPDVNKEKNAHSKFLKIKEALRKIYLLFVVIEKMISVLLG